MSKDPFQVLFKDGKAVDNPNVRSILNAYGVRTPDDIRKVADRTHEAIANGETPDHTDDACLYNHPAIVAAIRAEAAMEN